MEEPLTKQQKRELKRHMKEAKRATLGRKSRITSILWWGAFLLVLAGLIGYVVWDIVRPLSGAKIEILERSHVPDGEKPTYNSNPPTSGAHYERTEAWGISDKPLVAERLVHNLEHGGIVIYYKCDTKTDKSCEELITKLKDITQRLMKKDKKVVLTPNEKIDSKIAVTAWGWLDKMEDVDEERIRKFFSDHINRGPERVLM
jgi:hypothetical protein